VLSEDSAADASGGNRGGGRALYHEFEGPVIEQDAVARADVSWEARIVGGDRPVAADNLVGRDDERLSLPQLERAVPQAADPDLVAGEVLQHGHRAAGLALGGPHGFIAAGMLVGLAVREVQPHDVGAGIDQGPDLLCVAGRRAERGDDAGTPVPVLGHTGEFHPKLSMPLRRVKDTSLPILSEVIARSPSALLRAGCAPKLAGNSTLSLRGPKGRSNRRQPAIASLRLARSGARLRSQ